jgi:hypothetical protein
MAAIRRFWRQTCRHYRNFQIAYTILTLQFAVPAIVYAVAPGVALEQFARLNALLGGTTYAFSDGVVRLWRYLGTAHVAAMAFMCLYLQRNLREHRPILVPLLFLKGLAGTCWMAGFVATPSYPILLVASLVDYATCVVLFGFAMFARAEIDTVSDTLLVPRPTRQHPLGWTALETRWADALLEAMIPPRDEGRLPAYADVDTRDFWESLRQYAPLQMRLVLRAAVWVLTITPWIYGVSLRTFPHLSIDERDALLQRAVRSDSFLLRQLVSTIRIAATFSYFRHPDVRRTILGDPEGPLTYDEPPFEPPADSPSDDTSRASPWSTTTKRET